MATYYRKATPLERAEGIEDLLVSFGNYLLSNERKKRFKEVFPHQLKERLSQVHDADLANWKESLDGKKMKTPHKILHECYLKNIKGIESISTPRFPAIHTPAAIEAMQEYARQAVTYALEQAAEKARIIHNDESIKMTKEQMEQLKTVFASWSEDWNHPSMNIYDYEVDKSSILSLKEQIFNDLNL